MVIVRSDFRAALKERDSALKITLCEVRARVEVVRFVGIRIKRQRFLKLFLCFFIPLSGGKCHSA